MVLPTDYLALCLLLLLNGNCLYADIMGNRLWWMKLCQNFLENCLEHEPSRMQRTPFLAIPHGPCIMQRFTIRCSVGLRM